jgi:heat shock protein HtpX
MSGAQATSRKSASAKNENFYHSVVLVLALCAVLGAATFLLWGPTGPVLTALLVGALYAIGPVIPPEIIMRLYQGRLIPSQEIDQVSALVDVLAYRAELPARPALYVIPSMTLNAFAAGTPQRSAIGLTEGLLRQLSLRETAGVIAHEMSHIRNNDLGILGFADWVTRFLQILSYSAFVLAALNVIATATNEPFISWWIVLLLYLAPAISNLLQLSLSRTREFDADRQAANLTGDPIGLATALRQLDHETGSVWEDLSLPVPARRVAQPSLLRSHPQAEERIARLLAHDSKERMEPLVIKELPMISLLGVGPIEMRPRYRWPGLWF